MKVRALAVGGIATLAVYAIPAVAPHSFAMFDASKTVTPEGSVKGFQWTHPPPWILLNVPNHQGPADLWAVERHAPSGLPRGRWTRTTTSDQQRAHKSDCDCAHSCHGQSSGFNIIIPPGTDVTIRAAIERLGL